MHNAAWYKTKRAGKADTYVGWSFEMRLTIAAACVGLVVAVLMLLACGVSGASIGQRQRLQNYFLQHHERNSVKQKTLPESRRQATADYDYGDEEEDDEEEAEEELQAALGGAGNRGSDGQDDDNGNEETEGDDYEEEGEDDAEEQGRQLKRKSIIRRFLGIQI